MLNRLASEHLSLGTALYKEVSIDFQKAKSFLNETTGKAANGFTELSNKSLSNVSEVAEKVNSSLNETVGGAVTTITNKTGEAINTAAEITDKAKGSLSQTAAKTSDIVAEKTGKAIYTFTQKAEHAKDSLTQTAEKAVDNVSLVSGKAVNTIAETAKQAEDSLLETFEKSKNSVEDTIQKAEQLSATASTAIENAVNGFINHRLDALNLWIEAHPAISWTIKSVSLGVDHPIYCIVIILLTIFILWQLIKTFSRLIEQGLLVTLTAPFKFVQSLFKFSFKSLSIFTDNSTSDLGSQPNNERLAKLLTRLEAIKQEQNEILQQITNLVSSTR